MSANILENDTITATEKTWHGLETIVPAIEFDNSGLDWLVTERKAFMQHDGDMVEIPNQKVICRQDNGLVLNISKDRYNIIQNERVWECLENALQGVNYTVKVAGSLGNCGKVFISVGIDGKQEYVVNGDKFKNHLTFVSSHDGSMSFQVYDTAVRVVCENTLNLSQRMKGEIKLNVRHSRNAEVRIQEMEKVLENLFQKREEFYSSYRYLVESPMTEDKAEKILVGWLNNGKKEVSTRTQNVVNNIVDRYKFGLGNNGQTKADLLNGVTEYFTRQSSDNRRKLYASSEFGLGAKRKAEFSDLIINDDQLDQLAANGEKMLASDLVLA